MAFIPAVNTARVSAHFSQDGQQVENVFYVQKSTALTTADLVALGSAYVTWWIANMRSFSAANLSLVEVVVQDMTTISGTQIVFTTGLPVAGLSASPALPNSITLAIKEITGLGGRSFRGRQYILGMTQVFLNSDQNTVTAGTLTTLAGAYNALLSAINAISGMAMVVASFFHLGAPRATAVLTPITSFAFADNVVDSQRRRLPGRGR